MIIHHGKQEDLSMTMSEKFKAMTNDQKVTFVGRVKKLYDAGVTAEEISKGLGKDLDLIQEAIEAIELANS